MSPEPHAAPPRKIDSAVWMKIIGAIIATVLFVAFLVLGGLAAAGWDVAFNCAAFPFFAIAFSVGGAMAAVFLGGGAAAAGNLGEKFIGQGLTVSAFGGFATLIILFVLSFLLKPDGCGEEQAEYMIELRDVPIEVAIDSGPGLWTRNTRITSTGTDEGTSTRDYQLFVLVTPGVDLQRVTLSKGGTEHCEFDMTFKEAFDTHDGMIFREFDLPDRDSFKLDYQVRREGEFAEVEGCFSHRGTMAEDEIAVAIPDGRIRLLSPDLASGPTPEAFIGGAADEISSLPDESQRGFLGGLIAPAHAATPGMPYADLRDLLSNSNDQVRVDARRFLAANFAEYAEPALADLFDNRTKRDGELLSSLLTGLASGIETQEPRLAPAAGRDLGLPLPYVAGREGEILQLATHPDGSVRQQARRLIQRFPVDGFQPAITRALQSAESAAQSGACPQDRAGHHVYAAIFYIYNRMIQAGLDGEATDGTDWDGIADQIQELADSCILGIEKADAALLDYGRALAYAWSKDEAASRAAVADFDAYLSGRAGDYYMQGHIERMATLWN